MKIRYYPGGKKTDIRKKVGKAIKTFVTAQGACSDGKYIYMAFEEKIKGKKTGKIKIVKLDGKTLKKVKASKPLRCGHGNDITYKNGILYVTHSAGASVIHRVDAATLKKKKDIKIKGVKKGLRTFNGIAKWGDGFLLRVAGGSKMAVITMDGKIKRVFKTNKSYKTSQGMDAKNGRIYRGYSVMQSKNRNRLAIFDKKGKLIKTGILPLTGELEGIFFVGKKLFGSVHRRYKKNGKTYRKAYVYRIIL